VTEPLALRAWQMRAPHQRYEVVTALPPPAGVLVIAVRRLSPS
jgi:hypothetical protein